MSNLLGISCKELEAIEEDLEQLSIQFIQMFQKYKDKGIISESEYKTHVKVKEDFLNYLNNKKKDE